MRSVLVPLVVRMSKAAQNQAKGGGRSAPAKPAEPVEPVEEAPRQPREVPVPELAGRAEQVGAIIVKSLDLAEAGLSLGITVLTRAGAAAQGAIVDRVPAAPGAASAPPAEYGADAGSGGQAPGSPPPSEPSLPEEEPFFLANRVPLAPGGEVRVSFSITNDSLLEPKRVSLRVEALVGDQHGVRIDGTAFAVKPARKTIPPMDFDKFVLTGTLPAEAPPDVYRGAVIVHSTDEMSIPVRLLVAVP
jgi:hypothetical protein